MITILGLINFFFVLIYGVVLTFSFAGLIKTKKHIQLLLITILVFTILQLVIYLKIGAGFLFKAYPLVIHLPLLLFLIFYMKRPFLISLVSVLSAYLLCTPRKWLGTFIAFFFQASPEVSLITQIIITLPLLFLLCKYLSPNIVSLENEPKKLLMMITFVPMMYYIFEYALTIYSELLYNAGAVMVEFMDCGIVLLYYIFAIIYIKELNRRRETELNKTIIAIKSEAAEKEIEQLRKSQQQMAIYRHDLQHHLRYLQACIEKEKKQEVLSYIKTICEDIENQKVELYCQNTTMNLILSYYIAKATALDIRVETDMQVPADIKITAVDLCVILANALDNAIHACNKLELKELRSISVSGRMRRNNLFLQIKNHYEGNIQFKNEIPVAEKDGHGIGTRSIIMAVEKHNGVFNFEANEGIFTVTVAL